MIIAAAGCAFVAAAFGQRRGSLADDGASRRLERGFDDAAIGMLMRTPRLHVLRVNTAMCALLGREAEEVVGRSILDFTYAEDVQRHVDWIACRFKGNTEVPLIKRYLRPDGSIVEAQVTPPVIEPQDSEVFCFSHVHDVTEQRRAERQKAMIARWAAARWRAMMCSR